MKTAFAQQLSHSPNLTPQLLQSIRLLQLSGLQLEQELQQALDNNPLLEQMEPGDADLDHGNDFDGIADAERDDVVISDELHDFADAGAGATGSGFGDEDATARIAADGSTDFRLRLLEQLALSWTEDDLRLASWWLDHTDDNGYLEGNVLQLLERGRLELACDVDALHCVRLRLLHGELPGVTAATLVESLLAQLVEYAHLPGCELAGMLLREYPIALEQVDVRALAQATGTDVAAIEQALRLIRNLRPQPVDAQPVSTGHYIHPDVMTWCEGGKWHVALCTGGLPALRVSAYAERAAEGSPQLRGLLDEARWLLRGLAMRNDTLLRTARILVRRQRQFLLAGEEAIAPLTLQDIASELGMHESTVSRITSGKYMQTPRGPIELKAFFASRIEGADVSGNAVRAMVKRLIAAEPAHAPLADATIATMLARRGIHVARRTIAKYRDQLNIGSARERMQSSLLTGTC